MRDTGPLDLAGLGFGPQGVAVAAAIADRAERFGAGLADRVAFFEKASGPGWQTGMLFRNADIQHHYLRDLATPRDPRSRFTFANFLKERDRIFEFGSLVYGGGGGAVSRIEWSEYVAWVAELLDDYVTYDSPVSRLRIERVGDEDLIHLTVPDGEVLARAIVYCGGRELSYPPVFREHVGERVFHATQFLDRVPALPDLIDRRVAVVGAGQSAIEVVQYLHNNFPRTRIACVQRAVGFHHGDHSPFVQRMFHPRESEYFFSLPEDGRANLLAEVMRANYAAVDKEAVSALYRTMYEDNLLCTPRIELIPSSEVAGVRSDAGGRYLLDVTNNLDGSRRTVAADVVVLATGYVDRSLPGLLDELGPMLRVDGRSRPVVNHDFSLATVEGANPLVFVPSAGEASHGLGSSSSFSMVALKAERVTNALVKNGLLTPAHFGERRSVETLL
jgi:L-ornithine N5-oxygenase